MNKFISAAICVCISMQTFSQNTFTSIHTLLQANCATSNCHSGGSPAGSLNLSGNETAVYNAIVEVTPNNTTAAAKDDKYIDKGYPERSFLLRKMAHGLSDDLKLDASEGNAEPQNAGKLGDADI